MLLAGAAVGAHWGASFQQTHALQHVKSIARARMGRRRGVGGRAGGWMGGIRLPSKKRALPRGINRDGCIGQAGETRAAYREWTHLTSGGGRPKNGRKSEGSDSCLTTRSRPKLRETFSPSKPAPPSITPAAMHRAFVALAAAALVGNGELIGGWEAMGGGGARARKNTRWPWGPALCPHPEAAIPILIAAIHRRSAKEAC